MTPEEIATQAEALRDSTNHEIRSLAELLAALTRHVQESAAQFDAIIKALSGQSVQPTPPAAAAATEPTPTGDA